MAAFLSSIGNFLGGAGLVGSLAKTFLGDKSPVAAVLGDKTPVGRVLGDISGAYQSAGNIYNRFQQNYQSGISENDYYRRDPGNAPSMYSSWQGVQGYGSDSGAGGGYMGAPPQMYGATGYTGGYGNGRPPGSSMLMKRKFGYES